MGDKRKQMRIQDEIECIDRRRSSRIIALEEKKKQEKERELALELEKKNNSVNHDIRNKGKGKATMEVWDDFGDFNEDENGPTKKLYKNKELCQLISSIKELGRQSQNASASRTNVSSVNDMLLKHVLEIVIDFLQRKDSDELFAEPANPEVVENYYEIVKQPMDFGTMRAKLHEGMYTNFEQFKRDVFLICSNAMNTSPATSKYHEVAEDINRYAKWIFEALSYNREHFDLKVSLNKRRPGKKPQKRQLRTSQRASPKPTGRNNACYVEVSETKKRDMYWPPSKPLVSEVLYANKPNIQLNKNSMKYKESLLRFVEDLGPTAQRVAAKKLEAVKDQQLCNSDTPTQNLLENVLSTQIIHQPTPQIPTQPAALNAQTLPLTLPVFNRPLSIPGPAAQENRIVNTINAGNVNIRVGPYQGNMTYTNDNWNACAATLLSNFFFTNDKGGSPSGIESSNARETMNSRALSKGKMVSSLENVSSLLGPVQENTRQLQLGVNKTSNTRQWNTSAGITNMLATGSSNNVFARVYPTRVISGPQPKPLKSISPGNRNSLSGLSLMPQPRSEDTMPSNNLPKSSLVSQSRPENFMSYMPSNNHTKLSLAHQPRPEDIINLSDLSLVSQPRPKNSMYGMPGNNLREPSLVHQSLPWTTDSMSSHNHTKLSLAPQPRPEDIFNLSDLSLVSQPRPKDSMYGMPSNNLAEPSLVHQSLPWTTDSMSSHNHTKLSLAPQPRPEDIINLSDLSLVSQSRPKDSMYDMPSNNLTEPSLVHQHLPWTTDSISSHNHTKLSLAHQPRPDDFINLSDLSLVPQPRSRDSMYGMPSNNITESSLVNQLLPWTTDSMSSLDPLRLSPLSQPQHGESIPSTPYQPMDFQAKLDSSDFNNSTCTMYTSHEQVLHQAAPYTPPSTTIGQEEGASPQLLWDNDHQPDLALQL